MPCFPFIVTIVIRFRAFDFDPAQRQIASRGLPENASQSGVLPRTADRRHLSPDFIIGVAQHLAFRSSTKRHSEKIRTRGCRVDLRWVFSNTMRVSPGEPTCVDHGYPHRLVHARIKNLPDGQSRSISVQILYCSLSQ